MGFNLGSLGKSLIGVVNPGAGAAMSLTSGGRSRGGGGLGADFTGEDMRRQQDFNINLLNNAYGQALGSINGVQGPDQALFAGLAAQYGQNLQAGIGQSGLQNLYGPAYQQGLQSLALRQGDATALSANRAARMAGGGRGGAFGGSSAGVREAQTNAALGTQANLLGANVQTEQGKSQVAALMANLLAQGAQQQLQAQLAGLSGQQALAQGRLGAIGGLSDSLLRALASISPQDTNKTFENTLQALMAGSKIASNIGGMFGGGGGGATPGGGIS